MSVNVSIRGYEARNFEDALDIFRVHVQRDNVFHRELLQVLETAHEEWDRIWEAIYPGGVLAETVEIAEVARHVENVGRMLGVCLDELMSWYRRYDPTSAYGDTQPVVVEACGKRVDKGGDMFQWW